MNTYVRTQSNTLPKLGIKLSWERLVYLFGIGSLMLVMTYVFLLGSTTMHVTMRKTLQNDIRDMQGVIADLEAEYLTQREVLTIDEAYARGFVDAPNSTFVYRYPQGQSVALAPAGVQ
jgi:hypothetical protein